MPVCLLAACAGPQSILDPSGPVAETIATTWWVMFAGALVLFALVMGLVFYAMFRKSEKRPGLAELPFLVGAGVILPVGVLAALLIYGTHVGRSITATAESPLKIHVTGHRWWWEVRYPAESGPEVVTANELRFPTGTPIELSIRSADVIHSFWIPKLGGKVDMIPGRTNILRLTAAVPGRFRGQCSEFCGTQHARMGFIAIAETPAEFAEWREARSRQASTTSGGIELFVSRGCGSCHRIDGTSAAGDRGPVLTHFASRPTLGGNASANTPENLRRWVADHGQMLKRGNLAEGAAVADAAEVELLARFLEQLE